MSQNAFSLLLFLLSMCGLIIAIYLVFFKHQALIGFGFFVGAVSIIIPAAYPNLKEFTAKINKGGGEVSTKMFESVEPSRNNVIELPWNEDKQANKRENQEPSPEDYLNLAAQAWLSKKYDEALKNTYAGLRLTPINNRVKAALLTQLGAVFFDLKNEALSSKYYNEAIKADPRLPTAHYALGNLYRVQGKYSEAENEYKEAIQLDPNNAYAIFNYGTLYLVKGEYKDAETKFKEAIRLFPKFAEAYGNLGILYDERNEDDEALKNLDKAIELNPGLSSSHINLGNFYAKRNRFNEAEKEYRNAINLVPDSAEAHGNIGALYFNWEKYDLAENELRKAIKLKPDYNMARQNLESLLKITRK